MLKTENLHIELKKDGRQLVDGLSFAVAENESLTLLGQSGCGKTMTCRAILGLLDPRIFSVKGEILFGEKDLTELSEREKRKIYGKQIAFIPQNPMTALDPSMRIGRQMEETLMYHSSYKAAQRAERIDAALKKAGLPDPEKIKKSFPYMLSGGMLQRVLIAMAVMEEVKLVIADEPTTALDVVHRNEIIDAFIRLRGDGVAVLMVTHDFAAARRFGGRVLIMQEGHAVETGDVRTVYLFPQHAYTKALVEASQLSKGDTHA